MQGAAREKSDLIHIELVKREWRVKKLRGHRDAAGNSSSAHEQKQERGRESTMLTLFKPWRSGKCLKKEDQSFDEAFNFTIQQNQYMKNFNLRYECNDARDDFSAQLKKGNSSGGVFKQWMSSEDIADLDSYEFHDGGNFRKW